MATDPRQQAKLVALDAADSYFNVKFPKSTSTNFTLVGADLVQIPEQHEQLTLIFKGIPIDETTSIASSDPVIFSYGKGIDAAEFNGYVHSVTQNGGAMGNHTEVACIGATYYMKDTDQKIYKNVSADQVVSKVARKHGLNPIIQTHPRKRKSIVQAGLSDWQFLTSLARQTGYALYASNTSLIFMSKDKIYTNKKANAPYFFYNSFEDAPGTPAGLRVYGTILTYNVNLADEGPELGAIVDRVITGSNPNTGASINETIPYTAPGNSSLGAVIPGEGYFE